MSEFVGDVDVHNNYAALIRHCQAILVKGRFNSIYVTLGEKGGILINKEDNIHRVPAFGAKAVDITGAGDVALAAISIAIAANTDILTSVHFASCVAGISVSKAGTASVTKSEVISFLNDKSAQ